MPSPIHWTALVLTFSLLSAPDLRAQGKAKPAPEEQTGLKAGAKAPKFTLKDQEGKERSLDEFLGKGKVALVFYRSADW
jgi:cytochrome oxidase Cu insertion factor (SCO1/SenC/PrrC family)